jgi:hypothetical protein
LCHTGVPLGSLPAVGKLQSRTRISGGKRILTVTFEGQVPSCSRVPIFVASTPKSFKWESIS